MLRVVVGGMLLLVGGLGGLAGPPRPAMAQSFDGMPASCRDAGAASRSAAALPNTARGLRERKRITVLAIGATPIRAREVDANQYDLVESFLERSYKGLDVRIVDRGVSGELVRDAAPRIQTEVALERPDVVFWQVGVADAFAHTPPEDLKATLVETIKWLKAHDVDVVLIGMRYVRSIAPSQHYRQVRQAIREAQRDENVLGVGHYEAIEALDRMRRQHGEVASELDLTDAGSTCMADFLSRALAAKLFAKTKAKPAAPGPAGTGIPATPAPRPN